ncbi:MAG TPA: nuclear transport factor 2 family protein [Pyrinomonadaceae bacterium]
MKLRLMLSALCALLVTAAVPLSASTAKPVQSRQDQKIASAVRAVLDAQVAAWNRGDIEGFMDGYARSAELSFVSGDRLTRGWQETLDRYKKSYDSREKMGQLAFTELEITPLGKDAAVALGRWQLARAADTPHGRFTLILRRTKQGWRIVHDHTSSA